VFNSEGGVRPPGETAPPQYATTVRVSEHDLEPDPPRALGLADDIRINPAPGSLGAPVTGLGDGNENFYVWLNRVSEIAKIASALAGQDVSDLFRLDDVEPHVMEMLGRDGYALPLKERPDGSISELRVRLRPFNAEFRNFSTKPRHEEYLEGDDRFVHGEHWTPHIGTFFGGGGLVHLGHTHQDGKPEDVAANPYAPNHVGASVGYDFHHSWRSEQTEMGGGAELSLLTEFGRSFKHIMDAVFDLEYTAQRNMDAQRVSASVLVPRGMETSIPQVLAQDLNPGPLRVR
jgi:hypothetical protein